MRRYRHNRALVKTWRADEPRNAALLGYLGPCLGFVVCLFVMFPVGWLMIGWVSSVTATSPWRWALNVLITWAPLAAGVSAGILTVACIQEWLLKDWVRRQFHDGRAMRCFGCGYSLTGLESDACPECGSRTDGPPESVRHGLFENRRPT